MMNDIEIGSVVRVERNDKRHRKCTGRAMVATVQTESDCNRGGGRQLSSLTLFWEQLDPKPVVVGRSRTDFLVVPKKTSTKSATGSGSGGEVNDDEIIVSINEVEKLLPFEVDAGSDDNYGSNGGPKEEVAMWKDRGDQLLKLGDASSAASYYEEALYVSSQLSVGATSIISVGGFPKLCEIDCIEDDDGSIDVTFLHNGAEEQLKKSAVLLTRMEGDDDRLQERILLNLTRCMLQISDLDTSNRQPYAKSAILGATLALELANHENDLGLPPNAQTALTLRCKAYMSLSKWKNAHADAKMLIDVGYGEGSKLLAEMERKKKQQQKTNKKLAREMCRLVQSASEDR